jgi:hypothetical protein
MKQATRRYLDEEVIAMRDTGVLPEDRFAPGSLERAVLLDETIAWAPYTTQSRHRCCEHPPGCHHWSGCHHCPCVVAWAGEHD